MATITSKQELIAYFTEKRDRSVQEGGSYHDTVVALLNILDQSDDITAIKSTIRSLHRAKMAEIQRTTDVETRIEQRKQLAAYDDCLTQMRGIPTS
jgi:hypothetical protein